LNFTMHNDAQIVKINLSCRVIKLYTSKRLFVLLSLLHSYISSFPSSVLHLKVWIAWALQ